MNFKKLFAVLLAVMMVIGLVPITAFAAETTTDNHCTLTVKDADGNEVTTINCNCIDFNASHDKCYFTMPELADYADQDYYYTFGATAYDPGDTFDNGDYGMANCWKHGQNTSIKLVVSPRVTARIGNTMYTDLQEAINTAADDDTIVLQRDINVDKTIIINKSITLDLGAYTITGDTKDAVLRIYSNVVNTEIAVYIDATTGGIVNEGSGYAIYAGEDLDGGNDRERTNLTINGGKYETAGTDCIKQIMGLCTINGGSYKSTFGRTVLNGVQWYGAEFKINGGSFYGFNPACVSVWTGFNGKDYTNFYHQHDIIAAGKTADYVDGWYTVVDGTYNAIAKTKSLCYPSVGAAMDAILGMKDIANLNVITLCGDYTFTEADVERAMATYTVTFADTGVQREYRFSFVLNGYKLTLPAGYALYEVTLEDGTTATMIKKVVAPETSDTTATETVEVGTADELLAAADDGKIIVLTADITFNETLCINFADGSILDLNGHTITLPKKGITVSGKNITIKNGIFGCAVTKGHQYTLYIAEGTTATIEGVTIKGAIYAKNGAELTLKDNTIKPWVSGNASAVYADGANVTVLSGTFAGSTHGIFKEAKGGDITVYGGRFDRKNASYKYSLSNFVADGYELVKAKDGVYKYEINAV